jgi:hypothetical protein
VRDEGFALAGGEREEQARGEAGQNAGNYCGGDDPDEGVQAEGMLARPGRVQWRSMLLASLLTAKHNPRVNTSDMARALGSKGGKSRAKRLAPDEKRRIAALGGRARALSIHATRRVIENLHYASAMAALQPAPKVARLRNFAGPLPGLHGARTPQR